MIIHSMDNPSSIGLFNGQMGYIICLVHCSKVLNKPYLEDVADFLFQNIAMRVLDQSDIFFANGLSGICWGVEYLVSYGFMPGPADDICRAADVKIMQYDIRRIKKMTLGNGLIGLCHYMVSRIQGNLRNAISMPFDKQYITDWQNLLESKALNIPNDLYHTLATSLIGEQIEQTFSLTCIYDEFRNRQEKDNLLFNNYTRSLMRDLSKYITI